MRDTNEPCDDGDLHVTTITITRYLAPDGQDIIAHNIQGDPHVAMALGMLALTTDTILREAAGEFDDPDDET